MTKRRMMFQQIRFMQGWRVALWVAFLNVFRIISNPWKCKACGLRGCAPIDFSDGTTDWHCRAGCGAQYVEVHETGEIIWPKVQIGTGASGGQN